MPVPSPKIFVSAKKASILHFVPRPPSEKSPPATTTRLGLREFLVASGFLLVVVLVMAIMFLLEKYV